jgi:uncharacterized protein YjbJ (UPF0337 family)
MSAQVRQSRPSADARAGKWERHVGSARIVWARLTDEELLKSEGEAERLAGLVQERYAISRETADRNVRNFLQQFKL